MDKKVILAVAGSGKTRLLIERLNTEERFLIITYTNNNHMNLRQRVVKKFGFVPENIKLYTYFTFLNSFCFKPFLGDKYSAKGISWDFPPDYTRFRDNDAHYKSSTGRLFSNRLAKLVQKSALADVYERLEKYYDVMLVDEVQDFGGHDLNLLCSLAGAAIEQVLVGDFYQHTFDTSKDGPTNAKVYGDYSKYLKKIESAGYQSDKETLIKSYRCSPTVCTFIVDNLGIQIESHRVDETEIHYIENEDDADVLFSNNELVKLFYQNHIKYPCYSENWGKSKGQDNYQDVCLVLNGSGHKAFKSGTLSAMAAGTKSKFYVACTRTRGTLYFVDEKLFKKYKLD